MAIGCLLHARRGQPAVPTVWCLLGLFVLASGITILQVAANPLAAALGDPEYSHFRLTFSQTFNSLGTFIGPYLGARSCSSRASRPRNARRPHRRRA